jgi:S1-C subfamily serine protease
VALYDPENDLAVLRVPSARHTPLRFLASAPASRTPVHVVGFPLNATRTRASGYVEGEISAQSRDIYNQSLRAREFLVLEVNVNPGNSGSPVFEGSHVVGVLESKSVSQQSTAYAIPYSVVRVDLAHVPSAGVASTQSCMP